jgi:GIY-YIG catalytic domain
MARGRRSRSCSSLYERSPDSRMVHLRRAQVGRLFLGQTLMLIYCITNRVNGKRYIGQTTRSLEWRWSQHRKHMNSVHFPIYRALRKYGIENFTVEVLATGCSVECLNYLEALLIAAYNTLVPYGYNLDSGGKNNVMHPDSRARLSKAQKGKRKSAEHRAKIGAVHKGMTRSFEQRRRLSALKKGVPLEGYVYVPKIPGRKRRLKDHCKNGHLLPSEPNTFDHGRGYRRCRICVLEYQRNYDKTVRKQPHGRVAL